MHVTSFHRSTSCFDNGLFHAQTKDSFASPQMSLGLVQAYCAPVTEYSSVWEDPSEESSI